MLRYEWETKASAFVSYAKHGVAGLKAPTARSVDGMPAKGKIRRRAHVSGCASNREPAGRDAASPPCGQAAEAAQPGTTDVTNLLHDRPFH